MPAPETLFVATRGKWRAWLAKHHLAAREIWLIFYKKTSGKPSLDYEAAVEEALCYGWIDSIVRRVDDEKYIQKFTPRKAGSRWSESNLRRVKRLLAEGKMTDAGLILAGPALKAASHAVPPPEPTTEVPADLRRAMRANPAANDHFKTLPPGYVKTSVRWINAAKLPATRARRIAELVSVTARGERLGLK